MPLQNFGEIRQAAALGTGGGGGGVEKRWRAWSANLVRFLRQL